MKLRILELAKDDLIAGYQFYEAKEVDCRKSPTWIHGHLRKA